MPRPSDNENGVNILADDLNERIQYREVDLSMCMYRCIFGVIKANGFLILNK